MSKVSDEHLANWITRMDRIIAGYGDPMPPNEAIRSIISELVASRRAALEAVSSIREADVAVWRWTYSIEDGGRRMGPFYGVNPPDLTDWPNAEVTPLYAHPAPISKGVTVKALSWEKHNVDGTLWTSEVSVTGEYMVKFNGKTWEASVRMFMVGRDYADSEAAKTACQDHHAARILSCLSHTAGEPD